MLALLVESGTAHSAKRDIRQQRERGTKPSPAIAARRSIRKTRVQGPAARPCETRRVAENPHSCAEPPGQGNLAQGQPLSSSRDELSSSTTCNQVEQVTSSIRPDDPCGRYSTNGDEAGVVAPPKEQVAPLVLKSTPRLSTLEVSCECVCPLPPMNML